MKYYNPMSWKAKPWAEALTVLAERLKPVRWEAKIRPLLGIDALEQEVRTKKANK